MSRARPCCNRVMVAAWLLVIGCGGEALGPEQPTWIDDVEPILRGNCFHCHGAAQASPDAARWDFYDRSDPGLAAIGDFAKVLISGRDPAHFVAIRGFVDPHLEDARRMPPPPAQRLSARDLQVLDAWREAGFPRGLRPVNALPTIGWLEKPAVFVVQDLDREQVLGRLTCRVGQMLLPRSGAFTLAEGLEPPCSALLYDGQDLVEHLLLLE